MGIATIEEYGNRSDTNPAGHAHMVSKGCGIGATCIERGIVLGQNGFGVTYNVLKACPGKKLRSAFFAVRKEEENLLPLTFQRTTGTRRS